jgi:hypothetical protein
MQPGGIPHSVTDVLDIRSVFPRVFEVVNDVLPHDVLALVCIGSQPARDARSRIH